ncbi:MAG TPA: hypothetical protein VFE84_02965, partial [Patescibacteria group bacterium]|nr:hypothetical protein [Patescibacteria group bacterium]
MQAFPNRFTLRLTAGAVSLVAGLMTTPLPAQSATPAAGAASPGVPSPGAALPKDVDAAMKSISAPRIKVHLRFLADDLLEGRGTGQRG